MESDESGDAKSPSPRGEPTSTSPRVSLDGGESGSGDGGGIPRPSLHEDDPGGVDASATSEEIESNSLSTIPQGAIVDDDGALIPDPDGLVHAESEPEENPGDRIVDWYIDHRAFRFDRRAQERFLRALMKHGRFAQACSEAGVAISTMAFHRRRNPDFARAVSDAQEFWKDQIEAEIQRRALEGWDEPVFGGRFKDELVGHVRRYDSALLQLLAKRHIAEYRDKQEVNHNHTGGVLLIPEKSYSVEELEALSSKAMLPTKAPTFDEGPRPGPVIDVGEQHD